MEYRKSLPYFIVLFIALALMMPRAPRFSLDYRKGSVWKHETLVAQFDFPIYKTAQKLSEDAAAADREAVPFYRFSTETVDRSVKTAEGISFSGNTALKASAVAAIRSIYSHGVLSDDALRSDKRAPSVIYVQRNKRLTKTPSTEVYKLSDAKARLLVAVAEKHPGVNVDSLFRQNGVYDLIVPNLVFDQSMTDLVGSETAFSVSPTEGFVISGQQIVSKGEIVTDEIARVLDSYRLEYNKNVGYYGSGVAIWIGNLLLALALAALLYLTVLFAVPKALLRRREIIYICLVFLLGFAGSVYVGKAGVVLLLMVPFPLMAMMLSPFFKKGAVSSLYLVSLLPLLLFSQEGAALYLLFALTGLVFVLSSGYFRTGFTLFMNSAIGLGVSFLVFIALRLTQTLSFPVPTGLLYLFISMVLSVALFPLAYIFEKLFGLLSAARLEDLSNMDNRLLRELDDLAPGTFQHSLQVMSMADAAARAAGADVALVRAGALYHDIGKMKNPSCFVENESILPEDADHKYHDTLTPEESARAIIAHVTDGVALARENALPDKVIDFIETHHGTGVATFFYNKYVNEGGDPANIAAFQYKGRKPHTLEQVILMICDSLEAASRTLKDNSPKGYSDLVENIVKAKVEAGQLEEASITMNQLRVVKETLKVYLSQLYHDRISYPSLKKKNNYRKR